MMQEDQAVVEYRKLALYYAHRYRHFGVPQEDLVQEGLIGIMHASRNWMPGGMSFLHYASLHIRSAMRRTIRGRPTAPVREGRRARVAASRKLPKPIRDASLDAPIDASIGQDRTLYEVLGSAPTQEDAVSTAQLSAALHGAIRKLPTRERDVVLMRLDDCSLEDVGRRVGISRQKAQRIEEGARAKLRTRMECYRDAA